MYTDNVCIKPPGSNRFKSDISAKVKSGAVELLPAVLEAV